MTASWGIGIPRPMAVPHSHLVSKNATQVPNEAALATTTARRIALQWVVCTFV